VKTTASDKIRNIALFGHQGSGKTMLSESLLFCMGETTRIGSIEEGNTVSDYSPEEIERTNSIQTGVLHGYWKDAKINLLDLPGFADFAGEWAGAAAVADTIVFAISAVAGIEVGTEQSWSVAVINDLPRAFVVTKIDRENADFEAIVEKLQARFGPRAVPLVWPIGKGLEFKGMVNVLTGAGFSFDAKGKPQPLSVPADVAALAAEWKNKVTEAAAEADDALLEKFFEAGELSPQEIEKGLRAGIKNGDLFPIFACAGPTAQGTSLLLDAAHDYFPSPVDSRPRKALRSSGDEKVQISADASGPLALFVFKTISEPHVGELSIFRVMSGTARAGTDVENTTRGKSERLAQLSILNGKDRKDTAELLAGDIGATVKLKNTHTGDTLANGKLDVRFPPIAFPNPVMREAISPKAKGDEEKMSSGLTRLHEEDPSFRIEVDGDIKQTLLHGQGEMQLDVLVAKLKRKFGVEIQREEPRIPYRETIKGKAEVQYRHKKQSGGRGQFGDVHIRISPLPRGGGFEFVDSIVGGVIPGKFIPSVEKGVVEAMKEGGLSYNQVVDVRVELFFGSYHTVDSSDMAFKIAGSMAFKDAFAKASPILLEPIFNVEVVVPEEFMGDVMGDVSSRRGKIQGMDSEGPFQKVRAQIPLAELYKYSSDLRSMTQGRGHHTRAYSHYEEVPREIATKIVEEAKKARAEEK
jgi:elongation factor G